VNFTGAEADYMKSKDMDQAQRDLVYSIDNGDYPRWTMYIQVMTEQEAETFEFNPFDLTKIWPHSRFPLHEVGVMELNENPANYFAEIEQSAFAPAHVVDGISYSPDKMLQGRLLSYPDAHRYRLGANYEQIPVNRCPFAVNNYQRDGAMRVDGNGGSSPNYFPNSFDEIYVDESSKEPAWDLNESIAAWYDRNAPGENDHYTQPGWLFSRVMSEQDKTNTVTNIVNAMKGITGPKKDIIINRQLCHFYRCSPELGGRVADGLGVNVEAVLEEMGRHAAVMA
jgi:catalase